MRDNSFDRTIERNYIQKWRFLIAEYEEVKAGRSAASGGSGIFTVITAPARRPSGSTTTAICGAGRRPICCRSAAGRNGGSAAPEGIEAEIVACRKRGMNRYEIHAALREPL